MLPNAILTCKQVANLCTDLLLLLLFSCMQCVAGKYRTSNGECSDCQKNFYCPGNGVGRVTCGNGLITEKRGAATMDKW
jgi:hypothetical protein